MSRCSRMHSRQKVWPAGGGQHGARKQASWSSRTHTLECVAMHGGSVRVWRRPGGGGGRRSGCGAAAGGSAARWFLTTGQGAGFLQQGQTDGALERLQELLLHQLAHSRPCRDSVVALRKARWPTERCRPGKALVPREGPAAPAPVTAAPPCLLFCSCASYTATLPGMQRNRSLRARTKTGSSGAGKRGSPISLRGWRRRRRAWRRPARPNRRAQMCCSGARAMAGRQHFLAARGAGAGRRPASGGVSVSPTRPCEGRGRARLV